MKNWIKLYRKITDWEYYGDNEAVKLFLHILLCADYKTGCYRTTLRQLSAEVEGAACLFQSAGRPAVLCGYCLQVVFKGGAEGGV